MGLSWPDYDVIVIVLVCYYDCYMLYPTENGKKGGRREADYEHKVCISDEAIQL